MKKKSYWQYLTIFIGLYVQLTFSYKLPCAGGVLDMENAPQ
jgi:hypothetical protein